MGIPGIGERSSIAVIGHFNNFEDFENAKQVASFIGINPSPYISGTSVNGKGRAVEKLHPSGSITKTMRMKPSQDLFLLVLFQE